MDADLESAILASYLRELPAEVIDDLMAGAVRLKIPASSVIHREGEGAPLLELVVSGIVRGFVTAPDGRTMTVRYCRPGALLGVMSLFTPGFAMRGGSLQALVDAELLALSPGVARRAAEQDIRVTLAFLREQSERAFSFLYEVPGSAFATVRQRVARHLLDLASEGGPELVVPVSQQQLAEAVGTVREVIVRVLRELRAAGVVRTERNRIVILDPARLIAEQDWNSSP